MSNLQAQNINTLEDHGKALAEQWDKIVKADMKRFDGFTKVDGFDTRLGKLMLELKAEGGERISAQRIRDCHLHTIDKRRRAEAMWFADNETDCRKFIADSKKGFTSLSALQKAVAIASKPEAEVEAEAEVKSDVGPKASDGGSITAEEVYKHLVAVCKANEIDIMDVAEMLLANVDVNETQTKVAAQAVTTTMLS